MINQVDALLSIQHGYTRSELLALAGSLPVGLQVEFSIQVAADMAALTIVGGGLAGLACGIRLRELGRDATVYEKRRYPLKKVCGSSFPLGLAEGPGPWRRAPLPLQPVPLRQARFYYSKSSHFDFNLEPEALGISREALDSALAARFRELGGQLTEGEAFEGKDAIDASGRPLSGGKLQNG